MKYQVDLYKSLAFDAKYKAHWPIKPPMKVFNYMVTNYTPNHRNIIPSSTTFAGSVDGNIHAFPWVRDYFVAFESIWAWHTPLVYHIWTIRRSRLISWLSVKVKADQLTQCEGQGWAWHTPLTSIYGRKWTLGRLRLITQPSLSVCPIPSVWSQFWKWKHLKSVLNNLAMYILQNSVKINWEKCLESSWNSVFCGHM